MSTVGGQSDASRALQSSGGYPKRHVVARCYAAGEQLSLLIIFPELFRPILNLVNVDGSYDSLACRKQPVVCRLFRVSPDEENIFILMVFDFGVCWRLCSAWKPDGELRIIFVEGPAFITVHKILKEFLSMRLEE